MDKLGKLSASSRSRAFQDLFADPKIAVGEVARFGLAGLASEVRAKGKAAASQTTRTNHQALCLMKTLPVLGLVPGSRVKAACASDGRGDAFSSGSSGSRVGEFGCFKGLRNEIKRAGGRAASQTARAPLRRRFV